jgi:hypothetical protein
MNAHLLGTTVADVFDAILRENPSIVYIVNPTVPVLERIGQVVSGTDVEGPEICIIGETDTLKDVLDDFIVASSIADLIEAGVLEIRATPEHGRTSLIVTPERVTALVEAGSQIGGLSTTEGTFPGDVYSAIEEKCNTAEEFAVRTPARSRIMDTLESSLDSAVCADFEAMLSTLEAEEYDDRILDEVTISLLVAAKNEVLLYDISKWGEDVGIASKATFSRTKTKLEDCGLIDTEKVPIDVGRPRLRLKFQDGSLTGADPASIIDVAREALT